MSNQELAEQWPVGTPVGITSPLGGSKLTHEVVGHTRHYLCICPRDKVSEVKPGQQHVPVSRITPDRVYRGVA